MCADHDLPVGSELNGVVDEVQQHLAQAGHIAQHPLRHIGVDVGKQLQPFFAGALSGHVAGLFNRGLQIERLAFQIQLAGFDF